FSHGWLSTWLNCPERSDSRLRWRCNFKGSVMGECVRWPPADRPEMNMHTCRRRGGENFRGGGVQAAGGSGLSS
ncbi:LOW QUALITY PROTEIN: uncharacterized protein LOC116800994, partial [Drosophila sechellia]|uniref:LOW QUALITY PROTEIN: uncharacterized protein LOC116800994 n=1 Tax=Drosophila sechellia TaxID=7238 RepID=UPI0013DE41F7